MANMECEEPKDLGDVKTDVAILKRDFVNVAREIGDIKRLLENLRNPRPTNWVGICSFALALVIGTGTFVGLWLQLRLTPIEKDVSALTNDFKTQGQRTQRDLEWFFSSQADRHAFTDRTIDRMWDRVFTGDPPKFTDKPRP